MPPGVKILLSPYSFVKLKGFLPFSDTTLGDLYVVKPGDTATAAPKPTVCFIIDERQTRERVQMLHRLVRSLREHAQVELIEGDLPEDRLLQKLQAEKYQLIVAPWYRYLQWKRIEGAYGMTRTSGPTFCGYFADQLLPHELAEGCDFTRAILLDFNHLTQAEALRLTLSVLHDDRRCGLRPLLKAETPIHSEDWFSGQGLGARNDLILSLSSLSQMEWKNRANSIRVCLLALWSLIYDEGPGQEGLLQHSAKESKKATFQFAADAQCCAMRLVYVIPGNGAKNALREFWPDPTLASSAHQILQRFSDGIRVHVVPETCEIEVTVFFTPSGPSEKYATDIKTLWIEPVSKKLLYSTQDAPIATIPHFSQQAASPGNGGLEMQLKTRERQVFEAQSKIRELTQSIVERDQMIRELKTGGVGVAQSPPPPDAESLILALQARAREIHTQVTQLERQIHDASSTKVGTVEIGRLEEKLIRVTQKEQELILKVEAALEAFRATRSKQRRQPA